MLKVCLFEMSDKNAQSTKARFGISGLDDILLGGLRRNRLFLFEGNPGTGKTTLALQFLLEGARVGEKNLCITLSETAAELKEVALSHGWSLEGSMDVAPPENLLDASTSWVPLKITCKLSFLRQFRDTPSA
jgi:circadian clock protein KaiC